MECSSDPPPCEPSQWFARTCAEHFEGKPPDCPEPPGFAEPRDRADCGIVPGAPDDPDFARCGSQQKRINSPATPCRPPAITVVLSNTACILLEVCWTVSLIVSPPKPNIFVSCSIERCAMRPATSLPPCDRWPSQSCSARLSCPLYAASLAPSKGRLIRCTVLGSTPKRFAIFRTPSVRPGALRAARIRASSSGAIRGRPRAACPLGTSPRPA